MANTPDQTTCVATNDGRSDLLPLSPFNSLHYHFGMLLGVDDFETEQAYHRAKMRLHNAWLHGEGVVWGFGVKLDETSGEVRVASGLALDAAGHELHLEAEACLNLGEWFDKHQQDPDFTIEDDSGKKKFDAHVVIRFKACLTRQVPSLIEPCSNGGTGTAYSRVFETVEILLLPNLAPARAYPYHRLRLLFGLDEPKKKEGPNDSSTDNTPEDQAVLDELAAIQALPPPQQAVGWLNAFHRFAALEDIELQPAKSEDGARTLLFPGQEDDPVLLANLTGLTLTKENDTWKLSGGTVDTSVRTSHVATTTIQDLLRGLLTGSGSATPVDLGPRIDPTAVTISDTEIVLPFDQPLSGASVKPDAFSVSVFDATNGWKSFAVKTAAVDETLTTVTLTMKIPPLPLGVARIIARGTGATPLLGEKNLPLAGATSNAPVPEGADFVFMKERN